MLNTKGISILWNAGEALYKRCGKTIRNLKANAKEHGEQEKYSHLFLFEKRKGL